jgi:hypothetical protein
MRDIEIYNINQGGIADSDYAGTENSVSEAVNCDIHSESGIVKCNQALVKESGSVITDFITASVPCSNGSTYLFGDTGKIYERSASATYTHVGTASPAAGAAGILAAEEYDGYVYYAMEQRLGRFLIPIAEVAPTLQSSWATFGVGDTEYHPMRVLNLVLYIGDGHQVAQVDSGTFSANALDIQEPLRISALGHIDTDLLCGTTVGANIMKSQIVRWNTWSVSFSVSDPIPEVGVNCFIDSDNIVIVNCGTKGNFYIYDGAQLSLYKKLKGDFTLENKAKVLTNATFNFNGMPLFGFSKVNGSAALLGVYSIARTNRNYPYVLNLEYTISTGNTANIEIGAIAPISADQILVSWKDTNSGTSYGVDVLSLTAKATAYFTTRTFLLNRKAVVTYGNAHAAYRSLPDSAVINLYADKDYAGFGTALVSTDDTKRKSQRTNSGISDAVALRVRTELVPNANDGPEVEMLIIEVK